MGTAKEEEPPKRQVFLGTCPIGDGRRRSARPRARAGPPQYSDDDEEPPPPSRAGSRGGRWTKTRLPRAPGEIRLAAARWATAAEEAEEAGRRRGVQNRNAIASMASHWFVRAQEEKKEDDEELPERLKGCDKELVKRIEQEVIDSGSPVTFEDVAGLADAKRSIRRWSSGRCSVLNYLRGSGPCRGHAAVRAAGDWKNAHWKGHCVVVGSHVLLDQCLVFDVEVDRRVRGSWCGRCSLSLAIRAVRGVYRRGRFITQSAQFERERGF